MESKKITYPIDNFHVVGGTLNFPKFDTDFSKAPAVFAGVKAYMWNHMLSTGKRPKRWLKTTKKGTRVKYVYMYTPEEVKQATEELRTYIDEVNALYDLGIVLGGTS